MNDLLQKDASYYMSTRTDMIKYIDNKPKRILEIGCGAGNFSKNFTDVEYWGVEPNLEMAATAASVVKKILPGDFESCESKIPDEYFDLIVCNDVIEHMVDPIKFLTSIKSKLRQGGKLIASLPNLRYAPVVYDIALKGEFDYQKSGILDYTHLHLFTHKSFEKMAIRCGWHVELIAPVKIMPFKPIKALILRMLEHGQNDMRNAQFAVRISPIE